MVIGLAFGLVGGLFGGLAGGLSTNQIVTRTIPNEGIRQSLRHALISFLTSWLIFGLFFGLIFPSGLALVYKLVFASGLGLAAGLILGLRNGGAACLQHYILRFLLWRNDYAPWNYIRFLDYAAERVFLRKVGGGYIFTHRLLMEYFATLQPTNQAGQAKSLTVPGAVNG